jgi:hypothetical protein
VAVSGEQNALQQSCSAVVAAIAAQEFTGFPTGFLAALLERDDLAEALAEADGAAVAEADTLNPPLSTALDIAEEAGLNRKGLQRLLAEESADAAVTLKQHAHLAR